MAECTCHTTSINFRLHNNHKYDWVTTDSFLNVAADLQEVMVDDSCTINGSPVSNVQSVDNAIIGAGSKFTLRGG